MGPYRGQLGTRLVLWAMKPNPSLCPRVVWLTVGPLGMGGTSSQVRVNSFARRRPQLRVGAVDVNGEALFQVLQTQLHWVLGLQMLQDPLDQEALLSSGAAGLPQCPKVSNQGSRSRRLPTSTHRDHHRGSNTWGDSHRGATAYKCFP